MNNDLIFGIAFTLGGIGGITALLRTILRGIDSEDWQRVDGEIIETGIVDDHTATMQTTTRGTTMTAPLKVPVVRYRYIVNGAEYIGDKLQLGGPLATSFRSVARSSIEQYQTGKRVQVSVSPTDPTVSVLQPGVKWYLYVAIALPTLFLGIGMRFLLIYFGYYPFS